jgi:hypothetical protein
MRTGKVISMTMEDHPIHQHDGERLLHRRARAFHQAALSSLSVLNHRLDFVRSRRALNRSSGSLIGYGGPFPPDHIGSACPRLSLLTRQ